MYLTFGKDLNVHQQVIFSAISLLARGLERITVLTDSPEYYGLLRGRVTLRVVTDAELAAWRGRHDYFWRMKIRAVQEMCAAHPGEDICYLDGDTFCFANPAPLLERVRAGSNAMHAREGELSALPTKTERRMYKRTVGQTFGGVRIRSDHTMYNAGAILLTGVTASRTADLALAICDDMCAAGVDIWLMEQFSMSLALQETQEVITANGAIAHYWGNKADWNARIQRFFVTAHLRGDFLEAQLQAMRDVDFRELPTYRRSSSRQQKIRRWITERIAAMPKAFVPAPGAPYDELSERRTATR